MLPIYFGNVCLRMLPVLDLLLGRLLENEQLQTFERLVARYSSLYRYHDLPVSFVCDFLHFYFESEAINSGSWKLCLLPLLPSTTR
jgi:mediator of RNA polymerase II transcription subunit 23